jgi:hypothetical protein
MLEEERIQELKEEYGTVKDQLVATLSDQGDQGIDNYTRLKIRLEQIPHQIKFLEIEVQKKKVMKLEQEKEEQLIAIETAKQESTDYDLFHVPKIALLKNEAAKINQESLAKLIKPQLLNDALGDVFRRLEDARRKLAEMERVL